MPGRRVGSVYRPKYRDKKTGLLRPVAVWWIHYVRDGRRVRFSSKTTDKKKAKRMLQDILTELWQGRLPWVERTDPTIKAVLALVETHYVTTGNRSLKRAQLSIRTVLSYPPFEGGAMLARQVTEQVIEEYKAWRLTSDKRLEDWRSGRLSGPLTKAGRFSSKAPAAATINRELQAMRQGFRLATRRLDAEGRPMLERTPKVEFLREAPPRQRYADAYEFAALHAALLAGDPKTSPQDVADLALFYHLTGWRNSEPRSLRWEQVNWFRKTFTLDSRDSKSDEQWEYPFSTDPDLEAMLRRRRKATDAIEQVSGRPVPWVFHRGGRRIATFRRAWLSACRRVGIPLEGARRLRPHDFRRSRARDLMDATSDPFLTCELVGWKSLAMLKRYRITNLKDRETALAKARELRERRRAAATALPKVSGEGED